MGEEALDDGGIAVEYQALGLIVLGSAERHHLVDAAVGVDPNHETVAVVAARIELPETGDECTSRRVDGKIEGFSIAGGITGEKPLLLEEVGAEAGRDQLVHRSFAWVYAWETTPTDDGDAVFVARHAMAAEVFTTVVVPHQVA